MLVSVRWGKRDDHFAIGLPLSEIFLVFELEQRFTIRHPHQLPNRLVFPLESVSRTEVRHFLLDESHSAREIVDFDYALQSPHFGETRRLPERFGGVAGQYYFPCTTIPRGTVFGVAGDRITRKSRTRAATAIKAGTKSETTARELFTSRLPTAIWLRPNDSMLDRFDSFTYVTGAKCVVCLTVSVKHPLAGFL